MDRWLQLILLVPEDDFIANKQLAETLGVSSHTAYNDITQLNQAMNCWSVKATLRLKAPESR